MRRQSLPTDPEQPARPLVLPSPSETIQSPASTRCAGLFSFRPAVALSASLAENVRDHRLGIASAPLSSRVPRPAVKVRKRCQNGPNDALGSIGGDYEIAVLIRVRGLCGIA